MKYTRTEVIGDESVTVTLEGVDSSSLLAFLEYERWVADGCLTEPTETEVHQLN